MCLLFAKIGVAHCPVDWKEIRKLSIDEIVDRIIDLCNPTLNVGLKKKCPKIEILSPVVRERKGEYSTLLGEMWKRGFSEAYVDGKKIDLTEKAKQGLTLARYKKHSIDIKGDEGEINDRNLSRIFESVEKALKLSSGLVNIKSKRR